MRALIVDDEWQSRNALRIAVEQSPFPVTIAGEAGSVAEAIKTIDMLHPDVVLLDVRLGDGSGFEVIGNTEWKDFHVIFITAYSEYALKAFRVHALDYLLKPIDTNEVHSALQRLLSQTIRPSWNNVLTMLQQGNEKIAFAAAEGWHLYYSSDVMFCEADNNYSRIRLASGEQVYIARTLKQLETQLEPKGFMRVHKSYLVNTRHLQKFLHTDSGTLVLTDGSRIPVAQRKKAAVTKVLSRFLI